MKKLFSNVNSDETKSLNPVNFKPKEACFVYSRGYNSMMKDAAEARAIIRIGRSVLINKTKMDKYYESLADA